MRQPGIMDDMMLTAVSWVSWLRKRLAVTTPKGNWLETREEYSNRLKRCCDKVNAERDVEGLCRQYPKRLKLLKDKEGGRLKYQVWAEKLAYCSSPGVEVITQGQRACKRGALRTHEHSDARWIRG